MIDTRISDLRICSMRKSTIALFFCSIAASAFLGSVALTPNTMARWFCVSSYYVIFISFFAWVFSLAREQCWSKSAAYQYIRLHALGLCLAALLTGIFFYSLSAHFRTLADETNLIGISKSMLSSGRAENSIMGYWYYDCFHPIESVLDKRPNLFPFLVSLIHTMTGYSPRNGFVLNFFATFLMFFNLHLLVQKVLSVRMAVLTVLLTACYPIVGLCATSSGFEIVNALFLVLSLRYLWDYLQNPISQKLTKLLLTLVLFSQARYESAGLALLLLALIFIADGKRSFAALTPVTALIPPLFLPVLWQRMFSWGMVKSDIQGPAFSTQYLPSNFSGFLEFFFWPIHSQPSNPLIGVLAAAGLILAIRAIGLSEKSIHHADRIFFAGVVILAVSSFLIFLCQAWGNINTVYSFRFSLPFILFFASLAGFFLDKCAGILSPAAIFALISAMFFLMQPLAVTDWHGDSYILGRGYKQHLLFMERFRKGSNTFVIAERPGMFTIHDWGAADFQWANNNKAALLTQLSRHLITEIIVIQEIEYATDQPTNASVLEKDFHLKKVHEVQNDALTFLRYSVCTPG